MYYKFHGQRKDNDQWITGNLFQSEKYLKGTFICPETTYFDLFPEYKNGDDIKNHMHNGITLGHFHEVKPETVSLLQLTP